MTHKLGIGFMSPGLKANLLPINPLFLPTQRASVVYIDFVISVRAVGKWHGSVSPSTHGPSAL